MGYAIFVILSNKGSHGYHELRVIVLDRFQVAEFSLARLLICNDI